MDAQPGDWFVVDPGTRLFNWVELGERLIDRPLLRARTDQPKWGHAGVATRWADTGMSRTLMCVEARPGGAVERPWRWESHPHLWSTGTGLSSISMASAAQGYTGTGYSFLDYAAIAAHAGHLWAPGLKDYIAQTGHMICSQLVDQCAADRGIHLFADSRWPGYATPLDLALLLLAAGVAPDGAR